MQNRRRRKPSRLGTKSVLVELLSPVIGQFNGQGGDECSGGERQNRRENEPRQTGIEAKSRADERRGGRRQPEERDGDQIEDASHVRAGTAINS